MSSNNSRLRIIALYLSIAMVFIVLCLCGYYYSNDIKIKRVRGFSTTGFSSDMTYYDLPRMNVVVGGNLGNAQLRVDMSLEVAKRDLYVMQGYQPRITDRLNRYLLGINPDNIRRVSAITTLRHDMLEQINRSGVPVPVHDLLLRQLVIM